MGALAGAVTIIVVWVFTLLTQIDVPNAVAQAITIVNAALFSIMVPDDMEAP